MTRDVMRERLLRQGVLAPEKRAADVVRRLVAVQAQDFAGAKWALALRAQESTQAALDAAFDRGELLRTHVLRPTWHLVAPEDLRWMLALSAESVQGAARYHHALLKITEPELSRAHAVLRKALRGRQLTRTALARALIDGGVDARDGVRLAHIVMHAELEAVITSGARQGKQHTYALVDERVPAARRRSRTAALEELARRYLRTRAPASLADFAWWSGLSQSVVREAFEDAKAELERPPRARLERRVLLLPNYDELLVSYADRSALVPAELERAGPRESILFHHTLVVDGRVAGTWRKVVRGKSVRIELEPLAKWPKELAGEIERARAVAEAFHGGQSGA